MASSTRSKKATAKGESLALRPCVEVSAERVAAHQWAILSRRRPTFALPLRRLEHGTRLRFEVQLKRNSRSLLELQCARPSAALARQLLLKALDLRQRAEDHLLALEPSLFRPDCLYLNEGRLQLPLFPCPLEEQRPSVASGLAAWQRFFNWSGQEVELLRQLLTQAEAPAAADKLRQLLQQALGYWPQAGATAGSRQHEAQLRALKRPGKDPRRPSPKRDERERKRRTATNLALAAPWALLKAGLNRGWQHWQALESPFHTTAPLPPLGAIPKQPPPRHAQREAYLRSANGISLIGAGLQIGRDPEQCELSLADPTVARKHLQIERVGRGFTVRDLGSRNGSYLNRRRLKAQLAYPLQEADELRLGQSSFHFHFLTSAAFRKAQGHEKSPRSKDRRPSQTQVLTPTSYRRDGPRHHPDPGGYKHDRSASHPSPRNKSAHRDKPFAGPRYLPAPQSGRQI